MSSLAKQRQSWLDLVSQAGPTATETMVLAQVHAQKDKVQESLYCSETAAVRAQEPQTSVEFTEHAPAYSGDNLVTHNPSKHTQFL